MSGKFFFSWCLRFCTWVSVGGRFLFFSLMFENLLLDGLDQKKNLVSSLFFWKFVFFFFWNGGRLFSFLLDVWWSCLDDLDLKRKVGLPPFFFKGFCLLLLPWETYRVKKMSFFSLDILRIFCFDDLDRKGKIFLLLWCNVSVGGENFFFILIFENLFRWSRSLRKKIRSLFLFVMKEVFLLPWRTVSILKWVISSWELFSFFLDICEERSVFFYLDFWVSFC
jgi:hypothetical protein